MSNDSLFRRANELVPDGVKGRKWRYWIWILWARRWTHWDAWRRLFSNFKKAQSGLESGHSEDGFDSDGGDIGEFACNWRERRQALGWAISPFWGNIFIFARRWTYGDPIVRKQVKKKVVLLLFTFYFSVRRFWIIVYISDHSEEISSIWGIKSNSASSVSVLNSVATPLLTLPPTQLWNQLWQKLLPPTIAINVNSHKYQEMATQLWLSLDALAVPEHPRTYWDVLGYLISTVDHFRNCGSCGDREVEPRWQLDFSASVAWICSWVRSFISRTSLWTSIKITRYPLEYLWHISRLLLSLLSLRLEIRLWPIRRLGRWPTLILWHS